MTLHSSDPIIFSGNARPTQDISFPLSKKLQFRTTKEESITFDIVAQHGQKTVNTRLAFSSLADVIVEPTLTQSGVVKV